MSKSELADLIHEALRTTNNSAYLAGRSAPLDEVQAAYAAQNEAVVNMWRAFWAES